MIEKVLNEDTSTTENDDNVTLIPTLADDSYSIYTPSGHLKLHQWEPNTEERIFEVDGTTAVAHYEKILGEYDKDLCTYHIILKHFCNRMPDILKHINYFIKFYDTDDEFLMAYLSLKYIIDTKTKTLTTKTIQQYIDSRIMTDSFMDNIQKMVDDLYVINIDTDRGGNYRSTPKITNEHAKMILAVSFSIRLIMPACIHFTNVSPFIESKTGYIECFSTIFRSIISKYEARSIPIYGPICRFVEYRILKRSNSDFAMLDKKKQLRGDNIVTYLEFVLREVLIVKSIYKIDYDQSVVSYFDGIIQKNYKQFKAEKFKSKPVELSSLDNQQDSDDFLSRAEALEMSICRIDEANPILTKANSKDVLEKLRHNFNIPCEPGEFDFYMDNIQLNTIHERLLHTFYSGFFHDSTAVKLISRTDTVYLLLMLKKYLQLKGMILLPQLCTASVRGKFKENTIKNKRFNEKFESDPNWRHVLETKLFYVEQINPKDSPPKKMLSTIINSTFEWVDFDPRINGIVEDDIDMDMIMSEYQLFLVII